MGRRAHSILAARSSCTGAISPQQQAFHALYLASRRAGLEHFLTLADTCALAYTMVENERHHTYSDGARV